MPRLPSGSGVGVEVGKPMGAGPVWREQACWPHSRQVQAWASGVKRGDCCSEIPGAGWRPSSNFKALGSLWGQVQDLCCTAEWVHYTHIHSLLDSVPMRVTAEDRVVPHAVQQVPVGDPLCMEQCIYVSPGLPVDDPSHPGPFLTCAAGSFFLMGPPLRAGGGWSFAGH